MKVCWLPLNTPWHWTSSLLCCACRFLANVRYNYKLFNYYKLFAYNLWDQSVDVCWHDIAQTTCEGFQNNCTCTGLAVYVQQVFEECAAAVASTYSHPPVSVPSHMAPTSPTLRAQLLLTYLRWDLLTNCSATSARIVSLSPVLFINLSDRYSSSYRFMPCLWCLWCYATVPCPGHRYLPLPPPPTPQTTPIWRQGRGRWSRIGMGMGTGDMWCGRCRPCWMGQWGEGCRKHCRWWMDALDYPSIKQQTNNAHTARPCWYHPPRSYKSLILLTFTRHMRMLLCQVSVREVVSECLRLTLRQLQRDDQAELVEHS